MLAIGVVLLVALGFVHPVAHEFPTLRSGLESAMSLLALMGAWWMAAEFRQTHRLRTLLLAGALVALAETEFIANALPAILNVSSAQALTAMLPLGELRAAAALAAAAHTPSCRLIPAGRGALLVAAASGTLAVGLSELGGVALRGPLGLASAHRGPVLGHALHRPLGLAVLLASVGLFSWAAGGFARQGRRERSSYLPLLAAAALLLGAARLYFLTLPWVSSYELSVRELLRLGAFSLVLAAAAREDLKARTTLARVAAMAERSRVAQDLHDGLAQDLAFIAAHGPTLSSALGDEHPLVLAARNALSLSRHAISELSDTSSASLREALQAVGAELGSRFQIAIAVDVGQETALSRAEQDHVSRITREAISNAARHGQAKNVVVTLKQAPCGTVLRVSDDGRGIGQEPGRGSGDGFGLGHMRDRAAVLGGRLVVRPRRAGGTDLEVLFQ